MSKRQVRHMKVSVHSHSIHGMRVVFNNESDFYYGKHVIIPTKCCIRRKYLAKYEKGVIPDHIKKDNIVLVAIEFDLFMPMIIDNIRLID